MGFWQIFILIMKNLKYVVQFVKMIDHQISKGLEEKDLRIGLERMEKGFANVITIKETADAARAINDSLRK